MTNQILTSCLSVCFLAAKSDRRQNGALFIYSHCFLFLTIFWITRPWFTGKIQFTGSEEMSSTTRTKRFRAKLEAENYKPSSGKYLFPKIPIYKITLLKTSAVYWCSVIPVYNVTCAVHPCRSSPPCSALLAVEWERPSRAQRLALAELALHRSLRGQILPSRSLRGQVWRAWISCSTIINFFVIRHTEMFFLAHNKGWLQINILWFPNYFG